MTMQDKLRSPARSTIRRRGVTVIEVLFATGIAIFGLVGIASLIGVAGRQASDANKSSEGQALGQVWYSEFVTRGFNDSSRWRWYNDQQPPANRFTAASALPSPLARGTTNGTVPPNRTRNRHAICIDPLFFADPLNLANMQTGFASSQVYRPGLFPYYQDNYDPLTGNPSLTNNLGRLLRVSLADASLGSLLPPGAIERMFTSNDDLAMNFSEEDKTLPAFRVYDGTARGLYKGEYSWFATLFPREFASGETPNVLAAETFHTLSVVVCKRRDKAFPPATELPGERLLQVRSPFDPNLQPNNFSGGSGGRVQLAAHVDVESSLLAGDWVLLTRQQLDGSVLSTIGNWYRVIALDAEPDDYSTPGIWTRNVILDGPDWIFDSSNPTQATLIRDVATVLERVIPVY
ncbi:MAG: hypothetical protein KDA45_06075 [Planctomycetales bacterium]|nr:hypothetical protein [Planctomycetales bacterium]